MGEPEQVPRSILRPGDDWTHRGPEDDFFCLRFRVWYPSIDCAFRTRHRTCPACDHCDQGRFNLKRHRAALAARRPPR